MVVVQADTGEAATVVQIRISSNSSNLFTMIAPFE